MSIVLDEYTWAERAIREHDIGSKPSETLARVARYLAFCGYRRSEVRRRLEEFLYSCKPDAVPSKWSDTLDRLSKNAFKYPLIRIDSVPVTEAELKSVEAAGGKQARRLAVTLLCLAKYRAAASGREDWWVNTPDTEVMKMANVHTSIKRQCMLYAQLRDAGLIRFAKKVDNLSVQVLFVNNDSDTALEIRDFRNIGYQYDHYLGGRFFVCHNCGLTERIDDRRGTAHRPRKYCAACAEKMKVKQNVESVMRARQLKTQTNT